MKESPFFFFFERLGKQYERRPICTVDGMVNIKTGNCRCVQTWVWRQTHPAHFVTHTPASTEEESQRLFITLRHPLTNLPSHFVGDRQAFTPPDASRQGKFYTVIFMTCKTELLNIYGIISPESFLFAKNNIFSIINV